MGANDLETKIVWTRHGSVKPEPLIVTATSKSNSERSSLGGGDWMIMIDRCREGAKSVESGASGCLKTVDGGV